MTKNWNFQRLGRIALCMLLPGTNAVQAAEVSASDALPRPSAEQARWQDYEIGIFYHYDINL